MAGISAFSPPTDYGNLLTSFGQGIANQNATNQSAAQTQAQTALTGQQAQGAALDNQQKALALQVQRARQQITLKAIQDAVNGYAPQPDETAGSDSSASNGAGLSMGMQATPGNSGSPVPANADNPQQGGSAVPSQPEEDPTPDNWYDKSRIIAGNRQNLYVDPAGTAQEKQAIQAAILSGDPQLKEAALQARDNGVKSRLAASQSKASGMYDTITKGVLDAPEGRKMDALDAVAPGIAAKIRKMLPDDKVEEEEAAESYATFVANDMHQYTGRKAVKGDDGIYRDEETLRPMDVPRVGMNQQQMLDFAGKLFTPSIEVTNSDGSKTLKSPAEMRFPGMSPKQALLKAADQAGVRGASPTITGAPRAAFQEMADQVLQQVKQNPPAPRAAAAAPGAAPAAAPGTAPAPAAPVQAGSAAIQGQLLPGPDGKPLNINALPDAQLPPVTGNTSGGTDENARRQAYTETYKEVYTDANRKLTESNQTDALLNQFQQKLNTINPRDVGPGSETYKTFLQLKDAIFKNPDKDLNDMGIVDKFANQLGVQNVRQLLSGQRITNQEMMNFLTRASASVTQPIDVMRTIISYQKANNDFDRKWATTSLAALAKHKDPAALIALENARPGYVAASMAKDGFGPANLKPMPDPAKLKAYADKGFGGDVDAAKQHLIKNGYAP